MGIEEIRKKIEIEYIGWHLNCGLGEANCFYDEDKNILNGLKVEKGVWDVIVEDCKNTYWDQVECDEIWDELKK